MRERKIMEIESSSGGMYICNTADITKLSAISALPSFQKDGARV